MIRAFLFFVLLGINTGCGDSEKTPTHSGTDFEELQEIPPTEVSSVISVFGYAPSKQVGAVAAFYSGNRFFSGVVQKLSSQRYRILGSLGHFKEVDGVIEWTTKKTTCQKLSQERKGKTLVSGTVSGDTIVVTSGNKSTVLNRVEISRSSRPEGGFLVEWGCFDEKTGAFTNEGWSDFD